MGPRPCPELATQGSKIIPAPQETFTTLWAEALRKFEQNSDVRPARWDSLLHRMQTCDSEEDVCAVLDGIMHDLEHFRDGDSKWTAIRDRYLKPTVGILLLFNDAIAETAAYFVSFPAFLRVVMLKSPPAAHSGWKSHICSNWRVTRGIFQNTRDQ